MKKDQVDLENAFVWIPIPRPLMGWAEVPLTELALTALTDESRRSGTVLVPPARRMDQGTRPRSRRFGTRP